MMKICVMFFIIYSLRLNVNPNLNDIIIIQFYYKDYIKSSLLNIGVDEIIIKDY